MHLEADDRMGWRRLRRRVQPAERGGAAADQLPNIAPGRRRVRLRARYGDDDVVVGGQVNPGPTKRRHLATAQGFTEHQGDDRAVDQAAAHRHVVAPDAPPGAPRALEEETTADHLTGLCEYCRDIIPWFAPFAAYGGSREFFREMLPPFVALVLKCPQGQ